MTDILKAKVLAGRLIMAFKHDDGDGADRTLADVAKVIKEDPATYVVLCSALANYAGAALNALDGLKSNEHVGANWGERMLEVWLAEALDAQSASDD